ncbi:hypothetical protein K443DRAFT_239338 [Laccaria amethystina LaAM-08-1]|uniref:Uncharacterized protein n=1 Tax=Laccaria amethystina LaAM-08-1 TaxID=1095629 RepID=A0A0C9XJ94_9AGAR|nr:hypothetical protein K443DRAFT_239338 [Laccaria amethystina LaAM-08-1]
MPTRSFSRCFDRASSCRSSASQNSSIIVDRSYSPTSTPFEAGLRDIDDPAISNVYSIRCATRIFSISIQFQRHSAKLCKGQSLIDRTSSSYITPHQSIFGKLLGHTSVKRGRTVIECLGWQDSIHF